MARAIVLSAATTGFTCNPVRNWMGSTAKTLVGSAIARWRNAPWRESGRTQCDWQCSRGTSASTSRATCSASRSTAARPYCFATRSVIWPSVT